MQRQSLYNSNHQQDGCFSSTKKKFSTPALLFCKSQKDSNSKMMSENNSSLLNTNKSPTRSSNTKNNSMINKSPLISKSSAQSEYISCKDLGFSKSRPAEQNYQDISINESVQFCQNHQTSPASYISSIDDVQVEYYCQKCAILLASQGYSVQKIEDKQQLVDSRRQQLSRNILKNSSISQKSSKSNNSSFLSNSRSVYASSNPRKLEIQTFLSSTKGLLHQIQQKRQQLRQNLIQSEQFYGQQIQEVNQYFQLVYKSLQLQKNKCYNYILNQRVQVEQPVRSINETMNQLKQKILGIIQDIQQNIQTVYKTQNQIYRPVIQQYQDNYQEIQRKISSLQISQVQMRKIDFQGVPESIFYLSDLLKDSIQQNYSSQNQKKMNEQLNSLRQSLKDSLPQIQPKRLFSKRDSQKSSNNKLCFSFEGQALQMQLQQQKIIYQTDQY